MRDDAPVRAPGVQSRKVDAAENSVKLAAVRDILVRFATAKKISRSDFRCGVDGRYKTRTCDLHDVNVAL